MIQKMGRLLTENHSMGVVCDHRERFASGILDGFLIIERVETSIADSPSSLYEVEPSLLGIHSTLLLGISTNPVGR